MTEKWKAVVMGVLLVAAVAASGFLYSRFTAGRRSVPLASSASPESAAVPPGSETPQSSQTLEKAPDFTVYTADGKKVSLSDFAGRPVVLNFWASWCYYCKQEMPEFAEVYQKEKDNVQFLFIDWVGGRETQDSAEAFLKKQNLNIPVYYDRDEDAVTAYGLQGIPATFFIDKNGNLAGGINSMMDQDSLKQAVKYIKEH
jgi:thiol-disulfide isomerase/thioredoxin